MKKKIVDVLLFVLLFAAVISLILFPEEASHAASESIDMCLDVIVPSLFPFLAVSSIVSGLGAAERIERIAAPVMRPVFGVSGAASAAFVLGIVGGYPVGAAAAAFLYKKGTVDKPEAERLIAFCNNSGPAFILGTVGAGIFKDSIIGAILLASHIFSAAAVGFIFGFGHRKGPRSAKTSSCPESIRFAPLFIKSVRDSFFTIIGICGFVIFFSVILKMFSVTGIIDLFSSLLLKLGIEPLWFNRLFCGFFEMCSGVSSLAEGGDLRLRMAAASLILGWGGMSIHLQTISVLSETDLRMSKYFIGSLLKGIISGAVTYFSFPLFVRFVPAGAFSISETNIASTTFTGTLAFSLTLSAVVLLLFALPSKSCGKKAKKHL